MEEKAALHRTTQRLEEEQKQYGNRTSEPQPPQALELERLLEHLYKDVREATHATAEATQKRFELKCTRDIVNRQTATALTKLTKDQWTEMHSKLFKYFFDPHGELNANGTVCTDGDFCFWQMNHM
jgi:hypothetical protein